jgi:hypothetical protein
LFGREVPTPLLAGVGVVAVVLLALWARRRSPTAQAAAAEPEAFQAAQEAIGAGASGQASYADAAYNLEIQARQQELAFQQGQFEREARLEEANVSLQEKILAWASGKKGAKLPGAVKCPRGKPRFDPSTGQFYCREETSHGFAGDVLQGATGQDTIGGALGRIGGQYIPRFPGSGDIRP